MCISYQGCVGFIEKRSGKSYNNNEKKRNVYIHSFDWAESHTKMCTKMMGSTGVFFFTKLRWKANKEYNKNVNLSIFKFD